MKSNTTLIAFVLATLSSMSFVEHSSANQDAHFRDCRPTGDQTQSCTYSIGVASATWSQTSPCEVQGRKEIDPSGNGTSTASGDKCGVARFDPPPACPNIISRFMACGDPLPITRPLGSE